LWYTPLIACLLAVVILEKLGFLAPLTPWVASIVNNGAVGNDADNIVGTGVAAAGRLTEKALPINRW
jgi:hypothetical protein